MARLARIVLPGVPYHVTHRGNQRQPVFSTDRNRQFYLAGHPIGWGEWLALADEEEAEAFDRLRQATRTGRPCGDEAFVDDIETRLGRTV